MKQFLIVGSIGAVIYADVFPYIKSRDVKYRPQCIHKFENGAAAATWYTTLIPPYIQPLELTKTYNPECYPRYDNYDAIEVSKTKNIPYDYDGVMGVPITFLDKWNPEQFEIVTIASGHSWSHYKDELIKLKFNPNLKYDGGLGKPAVNNTLKYDRLMIKRR